MAQLELNRIGFSYPGGTPALDDVSLTVEGGDFVVLCGKSGCGKSTLLRLVKGGLTGDMWGKITLDGRDTTMLSPRDRARRIAYVGQNPESQMATDRVYSELAFGLENLGIDPGEIRLRVAEISSFFGIQTWFHRTIDGLSGGQKQLLSLAAAMVMEPDILLMDEPTAQLDPIAAADLLSAVERINRELGTTVIMSEHRLEDVFALCNRVAVLHRGGLVFSGRPRDAAPALAEMGHEMFHAMPAPARVFASAGGAGPCPVTIAGGREWLADFARTHTFRPVPRPETPGAGEEVLTLKDVWFRYERDGEDVLRDLNLTVGRGRLLALLGGNGTGKTTALNVISGLRRPHRGQVRVRGRVGMLPQDPQLLFQKATVRGELEDALAGTPRQGDQGAIAEMAALCRLGHVLDRHPFDLSGGEQQRVALAKVLLTRPDILLLDEPTKGMDAAFKSQLGGLLGELAASGMAVVLVSHDVEFCARFAHRCALFFDGGVITQAEPREFFAVNRFYTTAAARMARGMTPDAVTTEELITACGGVPVKTVESDPPRGGGAPAGQPQPQAERKKLPRRVSVISALLVLSMPLTLIFGIYLLDDRQYTVVSLLMLFEAMAAMAVRFEGRRPRAREVVLIAVLCALGVLGKTAFIMVPQFKPVAALVIVTGIALGGETGFLVGALTGMVSNLFFGQGPWTPWQMLAYGLIGLLAGLLFRRGRGGNRVLLCIFGGLAVFVIYGGLMNVASVLMYQPRPTWEMIVTALLLGAPFDLIHAASTVVFLLLLAGPLLEKLERIKRKYGVARA